MNANSKRIERTDRMKIQSYSSDKSYFEKSESFWLEQEEANSLFWEFSGKKGGLKSRWRGNVFYQGSVIGSALITQASHLLIAKSKPNAIQHLTRYLKLNKIVLHGIIGAKSETEYFLNYWSSGNPNFTNEIKKSFSVFLSPRRRVKSDTSLRIVEVGEREWPRAQLWAKAFANESIPRLSKNQTQLFAKHMMEKKQLFFLKNLNQETLAMGGFGRWTPNRSIINLVYVPPEKRNKGFASKLIGKLIDRSESLNCKKSVLFSDRSGDRNLYAKMGFKRKELIQEISFNKGTNPPLAIHGSRR